MRGEVPQFKRCCFCIPLRRGLIGWGYAKLALDLWMIPNIIMMIRFYMYYTLFVSAIDIVILACISASLLADICFNILFIVAGHTKSIKMLKISYIYNWVWLGIELAVIAFNLYLIFYYLYRGSRQHRALHALLYVSASAFATIFVQVYLILLIRSELIKLQNQTLEMQYTNHLASGEAGDPQCTLHRASTSDADQCTGENARAVEV